MYDDECEDLDERALEDIAETVQDAIYEGEICSREELEDFIFDQLDRFDIDTEDPRNIETVLNWLEDIDF